MASLIWLLIPLMGAISAAFWASWAARQSAEKGSGDAAGVAGYDAFRSVMERSAAERHGGRRPSAEQAPAPVRTGPDTLPGDAPDGSSRTAG